jgi:hypothetical protein
VITLPYCTFHVHLGLQFGPFISGFLTEIYVSSSMRAACAAQLLLLGVMTLITAAGAVTLLCRPAGTQDRSKGSGVEIQLHTSSALAAGE